MLVPAGHAAGLRAWAVAALTAVLLATACGGSSPSSSSSPSPPGTALEKTSLVVGALPVVDDAPLFLAIKNGYFKQQGLTVKPEIIPQSTLALPDLLHGTIDIIGSGNYVSYFEGQAQGTFNVRVLAAAAACTPKSFSILALPSSHIAGPPGLEGKTIAVNLTNNIQTLTTNAVLKQAGVSPSSVTYVVVPFPNMAAALKAHRVDAISAVEPFVTGSEQSDGAKIVMSECSGTTANLPLSGYFATQAWTQKYPNTARAFQRAIAKAQALASSDPAAVKQILPTYTKISAAAAQHIALNSFPTATNATDLQRVANLMLADGMLKTRLDAATMLFR
jgi:NitT/TauT family transport system substrate-binding protein